MNAKYILGNDCNGHAISKCVFFLNNLFLVIYDGFSHHHFAIMMFQYFSRSYNDGMTDCQMAPIANNVKSLCNCTRAY